MIVEAQVMPHLLDACPSFQQAWNDYRAYWGDDEPGTSIALAEFAHHLIDLARQNQTDCFSAVFTIIEQMITEGDEQIQNLAIVGFLEGIQNIASNNGLDWDVFVPWLGPASRTAWFDLIAYWDDIIADKMRHQGADR